MVLTRYKIVGCIFGERERERGKGEEEGKEGKEESALLRYLRARRDPPSSPGGALDVAFP